MTIDTNSSMPAEATSRKPALLASGQDLKLLVEAGMNWLKVNQQTVNLLNVFPVPDGDTGTNMLLTMQAAYAEIEKSDEANAGKLAHAVAQGALMGARGNSGVILSQIWRGFARSLDSLETMNAVTLVAALAESKHTAYKGVVRPVEGTILTVTKDVALAAEQAAARTNDLIEILEAMVAAADVSVKHTPELLPILKQAGVVDSGGKGLFYILEGMLRYLKGLPMEATSTTVTPLAAMEETMDAVEPGQDYEVVIDFRPFSPLDIDHFYNDLSEIGTSIQLGEGDGMYRMHIHVALEKRYAPIDYVMEMGTILKVAMENLIAQMEMQLHSQPGKISLAIVEPGQIAVIAISPGMGISRIFASLGVAGIVEGGQTMNPSTQEILKAFEDLPTDQIVILPNNKNIILAAQAAASASVKKVRVIACTSVPQGLSAMLRHLPDGDLAEVAKEMGEAIHEVETGEITVATRSVEINGVDVHEGEVIALLNGKLVQAAASLEDACIGLLEKAHTSDHERITFFYGANIAKSKVDEIVKDIGKIYPSHEIEIHEGGQPHYQFIISIE